MKNTYPPVLNKAATTTAKPYSSDNELLLRGVLEEDDLDTVVCV